MGERVRHLKPYFLALAVALPFSIYLGTVFVISSPETGYKSLPHSYANYVGWSLLLFVPLGALSLVICAFLHRRSFIDFLLKSTAMFVGGAVAGNVAAFGPDSALTEALVVFMSVLGGLTGIWMVQEKFQPASRRDPEAP